MEKSRMRTTRNRMSCSNEVVSGKSCFCIIPARRKNSAVHEVFCRQNPVLFESESASTKTLKGPNERTQRPKTWNGSQHHEARFPERSCTRNRRSAGRLDAPGICLGSVRSVGCPGPAWILSSGIDGAARKSCRLIRGRARSARREISCEEFSFSRHQRAVRPGDRRGRNQRACGGIFLACEES